MQWKVSSLQRQERRTEQRAGLPFGPGPHGRWRIQSSNLERTPFGPTPQVITHECLSGARCPVPAQGRRESTRSTQTLPATRRQGRRTGGAEQDTEGGEDRKNRRRQQESATSATKQTREKEADKSRRPVSQRGGAKEKAPNCERRLCRLKAAAAAALAAGCAPFVVML